MFESMKKYSFEGSISAVCLIFLSISILLQIFSRLLTSDPPLWTEEFARWIWIWLIMVGIAEVERTKSHLSADFFVARLPKQINQYIYIVVDLLYLFVLFHLIFIGFNGAMRKIYAQSMTLPVSEAVLYASFPIAGLFIAFRIILRIYDRIKNRIPLKIKIDKEKNL